MTKTPELDLPVSPTYRARLVAEVAKHGRNRIARLADIDPSTVHRNLNEENLTYTTAVKLRDAILDAYRENGEEPANLPSPFYAVADQMHWIMCETSE